MVKREGLVDKLVVRADGTGQVSHAGSALVAGVADRVGLTRALSAAMAPTRQRRSAHDPGVVLRDLAVMLADGGACLADLGALRDQLDLYGNVASDATAFRVIDSIDEGRLARLRGAVALARARAWQLGARPQRRGEQQQAQAQEQKQGLPEEVTVIDVDATLTTSYSDKEQAAGNFKGGFGHHPLLCYLDETGEALAGMPRPANAGFNTAADHKQVIDLALAQLDDQTLAGKILMRADGAGATHELTTYCREARILFSVGFDLDERVREAIIAKAESAWVKAIHADGSEHKHSQVCEITDSVDLSGWSERSRPIARRTKLKDGDQQSFADHDGHRLAVFLTEKRKLLRQIAPSRQSRCKYRVYWGWCTIARDSARQAELPMSCPWPTIPSHCSSAAHGSEASRIRWASVSRWWTRWLPARHSTGARCHRSADAMS